MKYYLTSKVVKKSVDNFTCQVYSNDKDTCQVDKDNCQKYKVTWHNNPIRV